MSEEDDYMSDAILNQCPDTRPGLVPKHIARKNKVEKKEREGNQKNKQKPKAVLEKEKRDEGLGAAISSENKGFSLLAKMGYKPGMAIGKKGQGRSEPVPVEIKLGRGGLGRDTEVKRKQEHRIEMSRNRAFKRQKMETKHKQDFMHRQNTKFAEKNVEKDLYKSQKVCEQLDSQKGIESPAETFFWPEALLPKSHDDTELDLDEPLDRLQPGYHGYVNDIGDDDDGGIDDDPEDDLSLDSCSLNAVDKLEVLTLYLRTKHKYCIWCGTKYEDKDDLMKNCPGNTAEAHDD